MIEVMMPNNGTKTICAYCEKLRHSVIYAVDGPCCIGCQSRCFYDGWERRPKELNKDEMWDLFPETRPSHG